MKAKLHMARARVKRVAEGGTINGSYKMAPIRALQTFRADLLILVEATDEKA